MRFEELKLVPGTRLKLTVAGPGLDQQAVAGRYIGCHAPATLLVAIPPKTRGAVLRNGVRVAVSVGTPTGVASFPSAVEATASSPYSYVHLLLPREVQWRAVRTAVRVAADLPAQVTNFDEVPRRPALQAAIVDLSVRGLKLGAAVELGNLGDEIAVEATFQLDDIVRRLSLRAKIRSRFAGATASSGYEHVYGAELLGLPEDDRILLQAYVLDVLHKQGPAL